MLKEENATLNNTCNSGTNEMTTVYESIKQLRKCHYSFVASKSFTEEDDEDKESEKKRLKTKKGFIPLTGNNNYVLNLSVNRPENDHLLVHLSTNILSICDLEKLSVIRKIPKWDLNNCCNAVGRYYVGKGDSLVNGSFNSNLIMLPTYNSIDLMDLRDSKMHKSAISFKAQTINENLNIVSFDVSADSNTLAAGTEVAVDQNAYLMIWDMRKNETLKTFSECHTDDITAVEFHPSNKDRLASGADDALVNIYDITEDDEEDALMYTLNAEESLSKIRWLPGEEKLAFILENDDIQFWDFNDAKPHLTINRNQSIIPSIDIKSGRSYDSAIDVWCDESDVFIGVGTYNGSLTVYRYDEKAEDDENRFAVNTVLDNGHHSLLRTVTAFKDTLLTGGEDGIVCLWNEKKKIKTEL